MCTLLRECVCITVTTHDQHVFSFHQDNRPCNGFEEALARYKEIVPHIRLAGELQLPYSRSVSNLNDIYMCVCVSIFNFY